jgi:hypothetical protein
VRPDDPAAAAALAVLTDRRLVVARADDLGIAHEALLTGWPRLHDWLEDGRSRADVRERLQVTATTWEEADHDPADAESAGRRVGRVGDDPRQTDVTSAGARLPG